jgi:hypothetical protein
MSCGAGTRTGRSGSTLSKASGIVDCTLDIGTIAAGLATEGALMMLAPRDVVLEIESVDTNLIPVRVEPRCRGVSHLVADWIHEKSTPQTCRSHDNSGEL